MATDSTCHPARSSSSSVSDNEEHNVWNPVPCQFQVGSLLEDLLTEEELGRVALPYRFALDLLCDESPKQVGPARSSSAATGPQVKHHCFMRPWHPCLVVRWSCKLFVERGVLSTVCAVVISCIVL